MRSGSALSWAMAESTSPRSEGLSCASWSSAACASSLVVFCAMTSRGTSNSCASSCASNVLRMVVLPAPFGPMMPIWSCGPTLSTGMRTPSGVCLACAVTGISDADPVVSADCLISFDFLDLADSAALLLLPLTPVTRSLDCAETCTADAPNGITPTSSRTSSVARLGSMPANAVRSPS